MVEKMLEALKRTLDSEAESPSLYPLSADFYSRLAAYTQKLQRAAGPGSSEVTIRLVAAQKKLIESFTRQLIELRATKASDGNLLLLLPEERYVCLQRQKFSARLDTMVDAVSGGSPSFIDFAKRIESERTVVVRFTKHVDELVGQDLRRLGPFEAEDVASLPAGSAGILVASGDAVQVQGRDEA